MTDEIHPDGLPTPRRYFAMLAIAIGITMAVLDGTVVNVALPSIARELGASPVGRGLDRQRLPAGHRRACSCRSRRWASGSATGRVYQVGHRRLHPRLARLRALVEPRSSGRGPRPAGARRRRDHEHERRAGAPHLSRIRSSAAASGSTASSSRSRRRSRRRSPPASSRSGPGPGSSRSTCRSASSTSGSRCATCRAPRPSHRPFDVDERAAQRRDVRPLLRRRRRPGPRRRRPGSRPRRSPAPWRPGVVLVRRSAGRPTPLIPVDLWRNPVFALSVTASICAFVAFAIAFVALPFYFQSALGLDQVETGLLMTPWPVALGLAAPLAGRLSDRIPAGVLGAFGMALLAVGLGLISRPAGGALPRSASPGGWRSAASASASSRRRTTARCSPRRRAPARAPPAACSRWRGCSG